MEEKPKTGIGWTIFIACAAGIFGLILGASHFNLQQGGTASRSAQSSPTGHVLSLACGGGMDVQINSRMREVYFIVPQCKCSNLSELDWDCTGWVRLVDAASIPSISGFNIASVDGSPCILYEEFAKSRGPVGFPPNTPVRVRGCDPNLPNAISTKDGQISLPVPDRFTFQNVQSAPITVRVRF